MNLPRSGSTEEWLNFDFQPKNEIDEFKPDIEQQHTVATKHTLSINQPGNSINQLVYFTITQKEAAKIIRFEERGPCMEVTMVSVHKIKIKQDSFIKLFQSLGKNKKECSVIVSR